MPPSADRILHWCLNVMGNKIVITGASSEIGCAITEKIAGPDDTVLLQCFKNKEKCSKLLNDKNINGTIAQVDFTNPGHISKFCDELAGTDILINSAAITKTDLLTSLTDEFISSMIAVNIEAMVKICRAVIPSMLPKRKGIIINISSIAASRTNRGQSVYGGTKGFVESFTRSLAIEFGPKGVRANCVAPGPIESGSLKALMAYGEKEVKESTVSPRLGTPEDVAGAVNFLCSDEAEYINGSTISVNGGFMRGI